MSYDFCLHRVQAQRMRQHSVASSSLGGCPVPWRWGRLGPKQNNNNNKLKSAKKKLSQK
jgi:hypothetical protein